MFVHDIASVPQHLVQRKRNAFQGEFARFNFRNIEDVVHDAEQPSRGDIDLGQVGSLLCIRIGAQRQVYHPRDRVHWRTDLMAHIGEKFRLCPVGNFGFNLCFS